MLTPVRIGDSVEVLFRNGRARIGTVQDLQSGMIKVLIAGAEGHMSMLVSAEKLRQVAASQWCIEADYSSGVAGTFTGANLCKR